MLTKLSWNYLLTAMLLLSVAVVATGCSRPKDEAPKDPAARSVHELLELRAENSTDTAAYLRHVESTALAEALAQDSASRTETQSPTPDWETPEVTKETTSGAEVTVRWKEDKDFPEWPKSTIFTLQEIDGRWIVVDAQDSRPSVETTGTP